MKVAISTIKKDKVFLVFCLERGVSKEQFQEAVQNYFPIKDKAILSEKDTKQPKLDEFDSPFDIKVNLY